MPYNPLLRLQKKCEDKNLTGWLVIIGGFIVHISYGTYYSYGNMTPYLTSYIRERSQPASLRNEDASVIFAINAIMLASFIPVGGVLLRKVGYRITVLVSALVMNTGVLLSMLSIEKSFYLLTLTYGIIVPVGIGIGYMAPVVCAMKWMPEHKGRVTGIVTLGFGGGSLIFDHVQTAYINPNNIAPTRLNSSISNNTSDRYFTDDDILDRIPTSFLVLGGLYLTLQLFGVIFLFDPPSDKVKSNKDEEMKLLVTKPHNNNELNNGIQAVDKEEEPNLSLKEVLQTTSFWNLWATFACTGLCVTFIPSLYKAFGQTFIRDDFFLAVVGGVSCIFNAIGRVVWGIFADAFSYRTAMLIECASLTVLVLTLIFTSYGGKVLFFVWMCIIFSFIGGNFTLFATAAAKTFGTEHVGVTFGLIYTAIAVSGPIGVVLPITLSDVIGWEGMFAVIAGFCTLGFILTWMFNVRGPSGKHI